MPDLDYVLIKPVDVSEPSRTWTRSELEILIRSIVAAELSKLDPECEGVKRVIDKVIGELSARLVE